MDNIPTCSLCDCLKKKTTKIIHDHNSNEYLIKINNLKHKYKNFANVNNTYVKSQTKKTDKLKPQLTK